MQSVRTPGMRRAAATALAVAMTLAVVVAQDPQKPTPADPEQPVFRARVNLVRVDVSVFGRDGKPLEDLGPSDFVVKEDGVPQKVETVQFVQLTGNAPSDLRESTAIRSADHAAVEAAREDVRLFVLFLDDYHVDKSPTVMIPLKRTLRAFIDKLGPYDLVAVMDPLTPLSHVEFTRDRGRLLQQVEKFEGRRGEIFPVRSAAEEAQLGQRNVWELRGGVTLDAMNAIVTRLGGLREGRKSVLFVSQGPPVDVRSTNWSRMEEVVESANRGNVTIHTLDPRPLGSSPFGGSTVLRRFSDETGGRAIFNTNDHAEHLDGVIADASAYYLVGYEPSRGNLADGKFHKIEVEVKRPRVRVVARRGYWSPRPEELTPRRAEPVEVGVRNALSELVTPKGGATAEVWVGFTRDDQAGTETTLTWDPVSHLDRAPATRLEVERIAADGTISGTPISVPRRETGEARPSAELSLPPGPSILRLTTYAADDVVLDRWHETVTVPKLADQPLALATPRFLVARSAFELRALRENPDAAPAATRRMRKTDRLLVELEAYAEGGAPELTLDLLNERGESLVSLPVPASPTGKPRVEIPIQSLAPATYVVRVTATTADGHVEQHAPFVIVP